MKKVMICILILLGSTSHIILATQKQPKPYSVLTYGVEWSYVTTFSSYIHQNFYSTEGYRVDFKETDYFHKAEAEVFLHVGGNFNQNWNLSLYAGYTKIAHLHYAIPISLRITRYYKSNKINDKWLSYIDLGSGTTISDSPWPIAMGKIGGGYSFALGRSVKLDIIASYRIIYTRPEVNYYEEVIPKESINRNNGLFSSITIGFNITL